jgi:hypothetical protein
MYRDLENQEKFYRIKCADWEYMTLAENVEEAASKALKNVIDLKGENCNLSFSMCVEEIGDSVIHLDFMYVPKVLEDIGLFKLSNELSSLSDFFLDKGKNPH